MTSFDKFRNRKRIAIASLTLRGNKSQIESGASSRKNNAATIVHVELNEWIREVVAERPQQVVCIVEIPWTKVI